MNNNKQTFFNDLLKICRKHKVNMTGARVEFNADFKPDGDYIAYEVDVNGAWEINNDQDQLSVYGVMPQPIIETFSIKGKLKTK